MTFPLATLLGHLPWGSQLPCLSNCLSRETLMSWDQALSITVWMSPEAALLSPAKSSDETAVLAGSLTTISWETVPETNTQAVPEFLTQRNVINDCYFKLLLGRSVRQQWKTNIPCIFQHTGYTFVILLSLSSSNYSSLTTPAVHCWRSSIKQYFWAYK